MAVGGAQFAAVVANRAQCVEMLSGRLVRGEEDTNWERKATA